MDHLHDMQAKEIAELREERDEARKKNADLNRRNQALESEVVKMKKRDRREERRAAEVARHMGAFDRVVMFAAQDKVRELERDLDAALALLDSLYNEMQLGHDIKADPVETLESVHDQVHDFQRDRALRTRTARDGGEGE